MDASPAEEHHGRTRHSRSRSQTPMDPLPVPRAAMIAAQALIDSSASYDGEATGTVEAVGLRVTRLRDVNGTVWYVRNGEILRVGNQSQNWARTVLDVTVTYETDLDRVQEILQQVATSTYEEPQFHDVIIEPPEVWGVERFDKDGVVVRVVLKTAPAQQWLVARAMRRRIKAEFDRAGIKMPTTFPMMRVDGADA